jgi:hypothetical protein
LTRLDESERVVPDPVLRVLAGVLTGSDCSHFQGWRQYDGRSMMTQAVPVQSKSTF